MKVTLAPAPKNPIDVQMESSDLTYSQSKFSLKEGQEKILTATIVHTQTGIAWVHGTAAGYDDGYFAVNGRSAVRAGQQVGTVHVDFNLRPKRFEFKPW